MWKCTCNLFLLASFLCNAARGQFGVPKTPILLPDQNFDGDTITMMDSYHGGRHNGFLLEQDAADMEALINEAKKDLETMAMITRMKKENKEHIAELQNLSPEEIIGGMKEALDNMKPVEYLFKDKQRAVKEMEKEGMIDKAHIKKYRKDPDLLEQDTRRGLYFQFISLAVVGGFIE